MNREALVSYIKDRFVINCCPLHNETVGFNCEVSLWKFNSASFIWVVEVGAWPSFISSAAFELSQTWKAKYLHVGPCLFNVKGTLAQQSK